jgi:outer membrane receptor protein involved in Fe transport
MRTTLRRAAWLFATAATGSALAYGSSAAAADQAAAGASAPPAISEVIVTAQKRSEALLSTAAPVTAVTSSDLNRQEAVKIADYAATVPGLNLITYSPGQTTVVMRGITTGFGAATAATTATYVDDAPFGSATSSAYGSITTLDLDPATIQRVEVLRGPQGTLYGASALGGLIKYVTTAPGLTDYQGRIEVDGNAVEHGGVGGGVRAMFDGPLVKDKLGVTISAFDRFDPGFIDNVNLGEKNVNNSKVYGGRLALLWTPTDKFTAEFSYIDQDTFTHGQSVVDTTTDFTPIYGKYDQFRYGRELWTMRDRLYTLRGSYDFGWATLTSITSYQTQKGLWTYDLTPKRGAALRAATGNPNLGVFEHVLLDHHKDTQELRLASPDNDKFEWLAGFFYTHEWGTKDENFQPILIPGGAPASLGQPVFRDILDDRYTEYAGYADVTYHFSDRFKVLGGIRYTKDSERSVTPFTGILVGAPYVVTGNSADKSVTYLISPSFNFDERNMVYARIASGFRPGGPTNVPPASLLGGAPIAYQSDKLTNYEVGYKGRLPDLRMTLDLSAFDIEWKNIQLLTVVSGFNVTGNAGAARSSGAEATWTWSPVQGLNITANGSYTDAHLLVDAPAVGGHSGDRLPDVPRWAGNLAAEYERPISSDIDGFVGGNLQYEGGRPKEFVANTPVGYVRPVMPAFTTLNLHAGLTRGGLTLEAYVRNAGDSYGFTRIASLLSNGFGAPLGIAIIQPRTFGFSISDKF